MGNFGFKNVSKRNKIDLMEYLCYGLGDFSFCFIYGAIGSYIVFFYTDVACISAATVGTVLLVSKIFDGISDMVYWLGTSRAAGKFNGRDVALDLGTLQC